MSFDMHGTIEYAKTLDSPEEALKEIGIQLSREIRDAAGRMETTVTDKEGNVTVKKVVGGDPSRLNEIITWLGTQFGSVGLSLTPAAKKPSEKPFVPGGKDTK